MKRYILLLCTLLCIVSPIIADDNSSIYIYRNDGQFNAFYKSDIDSITFSDVDADGISHADVVTQQVWTADSVYSIPLAAIDSIGYSAPETVVNKDVFALTSAHDPYIVKADTLSFTMYKTTPSDMLPRVGNIVAAEFDCASFPNGIIAHVLERKQQGDCYVFSCERASLDDIYDQIVYHGDGFYITDLEKNNSANTRVSLNVVTELWNASFDKEWEYSGTTTKIAAEDRANCEISICKTLGHPLTFGVRITNNLTSTFDFNAKSEASITPDPVKIGKTLKVGRISFPHPYLRFLWLQPQISLYGYFEEKGAVELNFQAGYDRTDTYSFLCNSDGWQYNRSSTSNQSIEVASLNMDGSAEVGLMPQIFLSLNGSATGIGMSGKFGLKQTAKFEFDAIDYFSTGTYEAIKDTKSQSYYTQSFSAFANIGLFETLGSCRWQLGNQDILFKEAYLLPEFSETSVKKNITEGTAQLTCRPSRDLLCPLSLGYGLYDNNGNLLESQMMSDTYKQSNSNYVLEKTFTDLKKSEEYEVRPVLQISGNTMPATPTKTFEMDYEYVDLGLPSGTLWATCNVGAESPEEYGDYFAWGETSTKSYYFGNTYKYGSISISEEGYITDYWMTKYCNNSNHGIVDNKTMLDSSDDAATANWGNDWKTPTRFQLNELINHCSWTWTSMNGVNGQLVVGPNGNSVFLPATGNRYKNRIDGAGSFGDYWSSSLSYPTDDCLYVRNLRFFYISSGCYMYNFSRFCGLPVRPVRTSAQ